MTVDRRTKVIGKVEPTQFANIGKILKSPWKFRQYGECGLPVSDLFPAHRNVVPTNWRS